MDKAAITWRELKTLAVHYGADYEDEEIVAVKGQPVLHVD
jgi:hypothetical protein